jgi:hypothetical protein
MKLMVPCVQKEIKVRHVLKSMKFSTDLISILSHPNKLIIGITNEFFLFQPGTMRAKQSSYIGCNISASVTKYIM